MNDPRHELLAAAELYQRLPGARQRARIRSSAGVTQRQMAEALGVATMTLWRWEQGARPRPRHAKAYLELLDELERLAA